MKENWKDIQGFENEYQVSDLGRVRCLRRYKVAGGLRKLTFNRQNEYFMVELWKGEERTTEYVHRLVAKAFIPNPENLPEVNHKNEIRWDNRVENLEWCTTQYNNEYSHGIKIYQYTLSGEFVREWKSASEVKRTFKYDDSCIRKAAKHYPNKTAYGFYWKNIEE